MPEEGSGVGRVGDPVSLGVEEGFQGREDLRVGGGFCRGGGEEGCVGVGLEGGEVSWFL